jgi:hypothetical protein
MRRLRPVSSQFLRKVGDKAWQTNATEVATGLIRVIPENFLIISPNTDWDTYRKTLLGNKIKEPVIYTDKFCRKFAPLSAMKFR